MRCSVPDCKNDSRHLSKSQGITFHVFPTEPSLRSAWLRVVGKDEASLKERSAICSEHFLCDDLYETRSGLHKVKAGAVPIIVQGKQCDYGEPASLKACRMCLDMESKLYPMRRYRLDEAYEHLTGIFIDNEDKMPQKLCVECITRLHNYQLFRTKSLRAHSLMTELLGRCNNLSQQSLKTINRDNNNLTSPLTTRHYDTYHYDVHIDSTDENDVKINIPNIQPPMSIQKVDIDAINTDVEVKIEPVNDMLIDDSHISDNVSDSDPTYELNPTVESDDEVIKIPKKLRKSKVKKIKRNKKEEPTAPKVDRRRRPFLNDELNETLFTIKNLTFEEQIADIEKRQESTNFKNSTYKCMECFKGFLDETAYNSHSVRHTTECGEYACDICKTHFKQHHALRKHITAHHTQRFSCNSCPYVTTHRQTARLHERWHKGTKYECPHCSEEFVKFTTYMGHIRIKHPSDFVCELCGYSFVSAKGIELHKKLKHRLDNAAVPPDGPQCDTCNIRFASDEALKRHHRVSARHADANSIKESNKRHRNETPKKNREHKERRQRDAKYREREEDSSRGACLTQVKPEGPIPCEQCGLQLEDSRAYHGHFRRMHPDKNRTNYPSMRSPCMCEICGRIFQSYALLKDHLYLHTGEKPFKCDECSKSFRMKQRLTAHKRVHAKVKSTYVCNVCSKAFSTHSNRQRHMFIHTGLKPFKCEMCGKCFKHASEKRAHITYVHLKKPWPKRQRVKRQKTEFERDGQMDIEQGVREMDVQPIWPTCAENKMADINTIAMMDDKPMYYNLKI